MGVFSKVKNFLNVGGVKIEIIDVTSPVKATDTFIEGNIRLTSKTERICKSMCSKVIRNDVFLKVNNEGKQEEQVNTTVVGEFNVILPLIVHAGEDKVTRFAINKIQFSGGGLADKEGIVGKVASFANKFTDKPVRTEYWVEVTVDVIDTPFDPSDKRQIQVVF